MTSWTSKIILCAAALGLTAPLVATPAAAQYRSDRYERNDRSDRNDRGDRYNRRDRDNRWDRRNDRRYDNRRYNSRYNNRYDNRRSSWQRHVRACQRAYRTYNARTDTYRTRYGQVRRCRL